MKINIIPEPQQTEVQSANAVFTLTRLAEISADEKSGKVYTLQLKANFKSSPF